MKRLLLLAAVPAILLAQNPIQRDPLDVDEILRQLGLCRANEALNASYIAKLQARIAELEKPKTSAVPKVPEGK